MMGWWSRKAKAEPRMSVWDFVRLKQPEVPPLGSRVPGTRKRVVAHHYHPHETGFHVEIVYGPVNDVGESRRRWAAFPTR
jgi:hypothetical protein